MTEADRSLPKLAKMYRQDQLSQFSDNLTTHINYHFHNSLEDTF